MTWVSTIALIGLLVHDSQFTLAATDYMGCFDDSVQSRAMQGAYKSFQGGQEHGLLTAERCEAYCASQGFRFMGLQYGYECFCSNGGFSGYGQGQHKCDMPCGGNRDEICGGAQANSVYAILYGNNNNDDDVIKLIDNEGVGGGDSKFVNKMSRSDIYNNFDKELSQNFIGCFLDSSVLPRDVDKQQLYLADSNSPLMCNAECATAGFEFFALQYGDECFCGNSYGKYGEVDGSECNIPCTGNPMEKCGGAWLNSVYKVDVSPARHQVIDATMPSAADAAADMTTTTLAGVAADFFTMTTDVIAPDTGGAGGSGADNFSIVPKVSPLYTYRGCYADKTPRDLTGPHYLGEGVSPKSCNLFCQGYKYYGMQWSKECYCGNTFGSYGTSTGCTLTCNGDATTICGGNWAQSVYEVAALSAVAPAPAGTVAVTSTKFPYVGCYKDDWIRDLTGRNFAGKMTLSQCNAFCLWNGNKYFGLEYGQECHCGDIYGSHGLATACTMPCTGDATTICGGKWSISLYKVSTSVTTPPSPTPVTPVPAPTPTAPTPVPVIPVTPVPAPTPVMPAPTPTTSTGRKEPNSPYAPRQIIVMNQCKQTIRVGHTGGRSGSAPCPDGMTVNPATNGCHYSLNKSGATAELKPGEEMVFSIPAQPTRSIRWSGHIWGATGCGDGYCDTGICGGWKDCTSYQGPVGPLTKAEFSFMDKGTDFYDITSIDGVNLPLEMRPDPRSKVEDSTSSYWCGNPGGTMSDTGLGGCSWNFDATLGGVFGNKDFNNVYRWVAGDGEGKTCTSDSSCTYPMKCGAMNPTMRMFVPGTYTSNVCGTPLGWWSPVSACSTDIGYPLNCRDYTGQGSYKYKDLYGCAGAIYGTQSGYTYNAPSTCCGCPDWLAEGVNAYASTKCRNTNVVWTTYALPHLKWLKQGCPTAYTFAYDDMSSTFTCRNTKNSGTGINDTSYVMTFCPQGSEAKIYA